MPFSAPLAQWNAAGIEPPQSLKDNGWKAGTKPPDAYFNWFMYNTYHALLELQTKAALKDEITISDASITQKGIVQLSNALTSTDETKAATSKAVKDAADIAKAAIPASQKGQPGGTATLDESGKVPASQLNISSTADKITIADAGGYFTGPNKTTEKALQEIGQALTGTRGEIIAQVNALLQA